MIPIANRCHLKYTLIRQARKHTNGEIKETFHIFWKPEVMICGWIDESRLLEVKSSNNVQPWMSVHFQDDDHSIGNVSLAPNLEPDTTMTNFSLGPSAVPPPILALLQISTTHLISRAIRIGLKIFVSPVCTAFIEAQQLPCTQLNRPVS